MVTKDEATRIETTMIQAGITPPDQEKQVAVIAQLNPPPRTAVNPFGILQMQTCNYCTSEIRNGFRIRCSACKGYFHGQCHKLHAAQYPENALHSERIETVYLDNNQWAEPPSQETPETGLKPGEILGASRCAGCLSQINNCYRWTCGACEYQFHPQCYRNHLNPLMGDSSKRKLRWMHGEACKGDKMAQPVAEVYIKDGKEDRRYETLRFPDMPLQADDTQDPPPADE